MKGLLQLSKVSVWHPGFYITLRLKFLVHGNNLGVRKLGVYLYQPAFKGIFFSLITVPPAHNITSLTTSLPPRHTLEPLLTNGV